MTGVCLKQSYSVVDISYIEYDLLWCHDSIVTGVTEQVNMGFDPVVSPLWEPVLPGPGTASVTQQRGAVLSLWGPHSGRSSGEPV